MLDISRSERYLILAILIIGTFFLLFSYSQKIIAPCEIETIEIKTTPFFININTARVDQLERLPGIGPVMASDIISYREMTGGFQSVEELKDVKGIGSKRFEKIKGFIRISE